MSRFGTIPGGISIGPEGGPVDRFGQPQVLDPNSELFRRLFGIPNPNTGPPASAPFPPTAPPSPTEGFRTAGPHTELNRVGFGPTVGQNPPGVSVLGAAASTPQVASLPPIFQFMLSGGQPAPAGPQNVQQFLANDPRRTVAAGSLAGLEGLIPLLFGGGSGLNLGRLNASLDARQSSALADTNAEFDARGLALRQDFARRGILNSGLAAGAEVDLEGARARGLGAARAGIQSVGAQADLQSQQLSANQDLERRRLIESLLRGVPGIGNILGGIAA